MLKAPASSSGKPRELITSFRVSLAVMSRPRDELNSHLTALFFVNTHSFTAEGEGGRKGVGREGRGGGREGEEGGGRGREGGGGGGREGDEGRISIVIAIGGLGRVTIDPLTLDARGARGAQKGFQLRRSIALPAFRGDGPSPCSGPCWLRHIRVRVGKR